MQEFVDATQIAQGVIFQYGLEYYRRRKPKSSAISICHFITFAPDMKWGIVDYYQQPKISFDYVKLAYQPLLVSLEHQKRRWLPDEVFTGELWVVNDLYEKFNSCKAEVIFYNTSKEEVKREIVSTNKYLLLVADEKVDLPRLREIGQEAIDKKKKYGSSNYLRYYEGLNGTLGVKQADEALPTVKEIDK